MIAQILPNNDLVGTQAFIAILVAVVGGGVYLLNTIFIRKKIYYAAIRALTDRVDQISQQCALCSAGPITRIESQLNSNAAVLTRVEAKVDGFVEKFAKQFAEIEKRVTTVEVNQRVVMKKLKI